MSLNDSDSGFLRMYEKQRIDIETATAEILRQAAEIELEHAKRKLVAFTASEASQPEQPKLGDRRLDHYFTPDPTKRFCVLCGDNDGGSVWGFHRFQIQPGDPNFKGPRIDQPRASSGDAEPTETLLHKVLVCDTSGKFDEYGEWLGMSPSGGVYTSLASAQAVADFARHIFEKLKLPHLQVVVVSGKVE